MTDELLTAAALAQRLGVSTDYAYRLMGSGEIAVTRIGNGRGRVRVTESALADYIASRTSPPRRSRRGSAA